MRRAGSLRCPYRDADWGYWWTQEVCRHAGLESFHFLSRFTAEQDVHLPRQRVRVAGGLQPEAALPVPQRGTDDQHGAPWREHQQLT